MALTKFDTINTPDKTLSLIQQNLVRTLNPVFDNPLLNGNLLQNIQLPAGPLSVNHKLGRNLVGWIITRKSATTDIFDTQNSNKTPDLTLQLTSTNPVTVDIYVF